MDNCWENVWGKRARERESVWAREKDKQYQSKYKQTKKDDACAVTFLVEWTDQKIAIRAQQRTSQTVTASSILASSLPLCFLFSHFASPNRPFYFIRCYCIDVHWTKLTPYAQIQHQIILSPLHTVPSWTQARLLIFPSFLRNRWHQLTYLKHCIPFHSFVDVDKENVSAK